MLDTVPWASDLAARTAQFGLRIAASDGSGSITYAELAGRAAQLAHRLRQQGVVAGHPVASALPNGLPAVWTALAMRIAGAAETALNANQDRG